MPRPAWLTTLLAALGLWHLGVTWPAMLGPMENDFVNYYAPARAVREGRALDRLYERNAFQAAAAEAGLPKLGSFVPHPPANALLLVPLAGLRPGSAKGLWAFVLLGCGVAAGLVLRGLLPGWCVLTALLLPTAAWTNALAYGQPYPLLLLLLALAWRSAASGREVLAGALLAPVVALKLYGLPLVAMLAVRRRGRAVAGFALALALLTAASAGILGWPLHRTYLTEVLPEALAGRLHDPYDPTWQSAASLGRRLFVSEPELNPHPALDWPAGAAALPRALTGVVLVAALAGARRASEKEAWALMVSAALAVSSAPSSYHFVLLALPLAVLLEQGRPGLAVAVAVVAASPLAHGGVPLAHGWTNLLAYPRLWALVMLVAALAWPRLSRSSLAAAVAAAMVAGASALNPSAPLPPGERLALARGYLAAEPLECGGVLAWTGIERDRLVVHAAKGPTSWGLGDLASPTCLDGRIVAHDPRERVEGGRRSSPDGAWTVFAAWTGRSHDICVRRAAGGCVAQVTTASSNELEPSWSEDGRRILFASDWRRGLGSTALYQVGFEPRCEEASRGGCPLSAP